MHIGWGNIPHSCFLFLFFCTFVMISQFLFPRTMLQLITARIWVNSPVLQHTTLWVNTSNLSLLIFLSSQILNTCKDRIYRVFQKDLNIFYSGHRGHWTWHPVIFFLWGYVKDNAYKPPLPQNMRELQDRIWAAVQTIDGNMLKRVWQERLSYWHLQSNEGSSHRAFVSWFW